MPMISGNSENAIWSRVIHPERGDLPADAARFLLNLNFEQMDLDRMLELTRKHQKGALTAEEGLELERFRQVGLQIDLFRSKARLALGNSQTAS